MLRSMIETGPGLCNGDIKHDCVLWKSSLLRPGDFLDESARAL